jgi:hypothetical protein
MATLVPFALLEASNELQPIISAVADAQYVTQTPPKSTPVQLALSTTLLNVTANLASLVMAHIAPHVHRDSTNPSKEIALVYGVHLQLISSKTMIVFPSLTYCYYAISALYPP